MNNMQQIIVLKCRGRYLKINDIGFMESTTDLTKDNFLLLSLENGLCTFEAGNEFLLTIEDCHTLSMEELKINGENKTPSEYCIRNGGYYLCMNKHGSVGNCWKDVKLYKNWTVLDAKHEMEKVEMEKVETQKKIDYYMNHGRKKVSLGRYEN